MDSYTTVGNMYDKFKLPMLRFYLETSTLHNTGESDDELPEIDFLTDISCDYLNDQQNNSLNTFIHVTNEQTYDVREMPSHHPSDVVSPAFPSETPLLFHVEAYEGLANLNVEVLVEHPKSLLEILSILESRLDTSGTKNIVNVCRRNVLDGGYRAFLRNSFNGEKKLSVKFAGESAIDDGGPSREFLRLAMMQMKSSHIFYGEKNEIFLTQDADALLTETYKAAGRIIAYAIVHRGPLPQFFHHSLFEITLSPEMDMTASDIPMSAIPLHYREKQEKINDISNAENFVEAVNEISDIIDIAGCSGLQTFVKKQCMVDTLKKFIVFDRVKPALRQFREGLTCLGVLDMITSFPQLMRHAFIYETGILNATTFQAAVDVADDSWSPQGNVRRAKEEQAYSFWMDYLLDLQEENQSNGQGLAKLLAFVTGSSEIPALGFEPRPSVTFKHKCDLQPDNPTWEFPTANTCINMICIPCDLISYANFKSRMQSAIDIDMFTTE